MLGEWTTTFDDIDELEEVLAKHGLAMGVMRTVAEISHTDWARERGAIVEVRRPRRRHLALAELAVALLRRRHRREGTARATAARTTAPC